MKTWLKKVDDYLDRKYKWLEKYFLGRSLIKLLAELIIALAVAGGTYWGQSQFHNIRNLSEENKKIASLYVSVSGDYVNETFGTPYISIRENEDLINNFYLLDKAVLRTVTEDNVVVAYFITSLNENRIVKGTFSWELIEIGKLTYADVPFGKPDVDVYYEPTGGAYYSEIQATGRDGMYNNYILGTTMFGFNNQSSYDLIVCLGLDKDALVDDLKKDAKPNTYGVISDGYEEQIKIIPMCEEWLNIYHLLSKLAA